MPGWLRDEHGVRAPVTSAGTLIGRGSTCSIVVDDPDVSRMQVVAFGAQSGAYVVPLGRGVVRLRDQPLEVAAWADDGDVLEVGPARFTFELRGEAKPTAWAVEAGGASYPISRLPFSIGSGPHDDLHLTGWERAAIRIFRGDGRLLVEVRSPMTIEGVDVVAGEVALVPLSKGMRIANGTDGVRLDEVRPAAETADRPLRPESIDLERTLGGGVLHVLIDEERRAWLPRKRAELVAALLAPPDGAPGAWIDDDLLMSLVWGATGATRTQLNTLIHRTRVSLSEAGLDGPALIERAPGGGATRFVVDPETTVRTR
jgi:hypothetical protein